MKPPINRIVIGIDYGTTFTGVAYCNPNLNLSGTKGPSSIRVVESWGTWPLGVIAAEKSCVELDDLDGVGAWSKLELLEEYEVSRARPLTESYELLADRHNKHQGLTAYLDFLKPLNFGCCCTLGNHRSGHRSKLDDIGSSHQLPLIDSDIDHYHFGEAIRQLLPETIHMPPWHKDKYEEPPQPA